MTITDIDNPVNPASIAAFLAAEHKRLKLNEYAHIGAYFSAYATNETSWVVYGSQPSPIGFVTESAATLDEAAVKFRAASDPTAIAAGLRARAAELVKQATKVEGVQ
jgi:hypothetical protein